MKIIPLHMDAWIVIILLFAVSFGFNFYQRYEYSDLLKDHIQFQASALRMEYAISFMEVPWTIVKTATSLIISLQEVLQHDHNQAG